jgi:serine/threonine-protein kinase
VAALAQGAAAELSPQSEVELHQVEAQTEVVTCRPGDMMVTTVFEDAELPYDHPPVDVPGVALEQYLGGGGQGWVYAGRVRKTGKLVAIKVLRHQYVEAKGWAAREALVCSRVRHPHILRIFETHAAGEFVVVVMEMIQGAELHARPLPAERLAACLLKMADALRTLHDNNIVHCDVKPANILLRRVSGEPVLVDFGVAWDMTADQDAAALFGTPHYLPPEA